MEKVFSETLSDGMKILIKLDEKDESYFRNALQYEKNMIGRAYPAGCKNGKHLVERYLDMQEIKYKVVNATK